MKKILYISYDGILEPLGQSQVLSYQEILAKSHQIILISFEKSKFTSSNEFHKLTEERVLKAGIRWYRLSYHKFPSGVATAFDILTGSLLSLFLIFRFHVQIVHVRSYVPAVIGLALKKITRIKLLFDMRGFWADERIDGEIWHPNSGLYKVAKWFEAKFLLNADHVVSLTHAGIQAINKFSYIDDCLPSSSVIPTCANLDLFSYKPIPHSSFTLGYVGSIGTWYNFDAVITAFIELLKIQPSSTLLVVNQNDHEYIETSLMDRGIPQNKFSIKGASHSEVPAYMNQMDAGIFFIKPLFSKLASAPTKLGEFLGCGLPCISNRGVGDMQAILEDQSVGVAIDDFSQSSIQNGINELLKLTSEKNITPKCVATAKKYFSLNEGVKKYNDIYSKI